MRIVGKSAVYFAPMLYGGHFDNIANIVEAETVVPDAQPELRRLDVLKALHVTFVVYSEAG